MTITPPRQQGRTSERLKVCADRTCGGWGLGDPFSDGFGENGGRQRCLEFIVPAKAQASQLPEESVIEAPGTNG